MSVPAGGCRPRIYKDDWLQRGLPFYESEPRAKCFVIDFISEPREMEIFGIVPDNAQTLQVVETSSSMGRPPLSYSVETGRYLTESLRPLPAIYSGIPSYCLTVNGKDLLRSVLASRGVTHTEPEPKKQKVDLSPEESEKRRLRRQKNKVAAAKCRSKRKAQSVHIHGQHGEVEKANKDLRHQLEALHKEVSNLQVMLNDHVCILSDSQRSALEREIESSRDEEESFLVEAIADSSCGSPVATPTSINSSSGDDESEW